MSPDVEISSAAKPLRGRVPSRPPAPWPGFVRYLLGLAVGVLAAAGAQAAVAIPSAEPAVPSGTVAAPEDAQEAAAASRLVLDMDFLARNLIGPDGIARNPANGDIYVSLEDAATIIRIRVEGAKKVVVDTSSPVQALRGPADRKARGLRSPEGLALDGKGGLYVVEDVPGGRLIRYDIQERSLVSRAAGQMIDVPFTGGQIAWESVDVGPAGELLLAGSTMEHSMLAPGDTDLFGLARGVILYRDADGAWWMPLNRAMASYSSAVFSPDGKYAVYACEISGEVGCLDLESKNLRTFAASHEFQAPEGLCSLPDGRVLVAEESGRIYQWDPLTDEIRLLFNGRHTIESLEWIPDDNRVLVTDDQRGQLLSLKLAPEALARSAATTNWGIRFADRYTMVEMIPDDCPAYLESVLKMGGYVSSKEGGAVAFREFAQNYCLVAVDADAVPLERTRSIENPITRLQFVIVAPYLMGVQGGELLWSSSGFVAVKKSGEKETTRLVSRSVIHGDLMECRFTPVGGQEIALPMPFSTRFDNNGSASIHFMGMGVMPDYMVGLNTQNPEQSFLLVMQPDEQPQQYKLDLPARKDRNHWVIALRRKELEVWQPLRQGR